MATLETLLGVSPVTINLVNYTPILQLQNGYWLAVKELDAQLSDAAQTYVIKIEWQ